VSELQIRQLQRLVDEWNDLADGELAMASSAPYESPMQMQASAAADSLQSCAHELGELIRGWSR
jgi:hypothetical protein